MESVSFLSKEKMPVCGIVAPHRMNGFQSVFFSLKAGLIGMVLNYV